MAVIGALLILAGAGEMFISGVAGAQWFVAGSVIFGTGWMMVAASEIVGAIKRLTKAMTTTEAR
jgi:hypothetical protein